MLNSAAFVAQLYALLPRGKAWTRDGGSVIAKVLAGIAPEFARVQGRAEDLLREMNPSAAVELLPEWESHLGLPDACEATASVTATQRQTALVARLRDTAGHNPADYAALAAVYGYPSAQFLRRPFTPMRAGKCRVGQRCYSPGAVFQFIAAYMTNLVASPNNFAAWTTAGSATVTADVALGPDDVLAADRLSFSSSGTTALTRSISGAPTSLQFSVWLRAESGSGAYKLTATSTTAADVSADFAVDGAWRRAALRAEHASGFSSVRISPTTTGSAQSVLAYSACVGAVDSKFECRLTHVMQSHGYPVFRVIGDLPRS